jgi:predicted DNA-binding protein YlxM (UPF0122 family)
MSKLNIGKLWSKAEEDELTEEYLIKEMSIDEIAAHHKRFRGGILSRLKKLHILRESDESLLEKDKKEKEEKREMKEMKEMKEDKAKNEDKSLADRVLFLENEVKMLREMIETIKS